MTFEKLDLALSSHVKIAQNSSVKINYVFVQFFSQFSWESILSLSIYMVSEPVLFSSSFSSFPFPSWVFSFLELKWFFFFIAANIFYPAHNPSSPYALHPNENPVLVLVSPALTKSNYLSWSRVMRIALWSKNKLKFVDGTLKIPAVDDPLFSA